MIILRQLNLKKSCDRSLAPNFDRICRPLHTSKAITILRIQID